MWKITEHKYLRQSQELNVANLIREMSMYSFASYAEQFENHFKDLIKDIPRYNNFSADLLYKVTQRNLYSVEVWKLTVEGDLKYKMFTLDYIKNQT